MASKYSSIDNSPTKQKYTFSKAERFPKISIYGAMSFYNLPNVKNERSTSFGYGSRYNFIPKNCETTPSCYDYSYGVQSNQPYAPKYSFGVSRERIKDNSKDITSPGPGKYYSPLKTFGKDSPKYSIKGKYKNSFFARIDSPGPAAYDPQTKMNERGVFGIAGYKNVKSYDFSKGILDRFDYKIEKTPGPSEYKKNNKSLIGNIYDSRFKSTHGIHIVFRHKEIDRDNYPGPGTYERYGDFYKYSDPSLNNNIYNKQNSKKNIYQTPEKKKREEENVNKNEETKNDNEINKNENEEINKNENEESNEKNKDELEKNENLNEHS